jgi:hypothetical protein
MIFSVLQDGIVMRLYFSRLLRLSFNSFGLRPNQGMGLGLI